MNVALFPVADYWWLYLAFTGLVVILLAIDLALHRQERPISFRNAAIWTAVWISLALAFSYVLYLFTAARHSPGVGRQLSLEFLAGYVVEESLSVDNMFVFALVFRYFAVPLAVSAQSAVLRRSGRHDLSRSLYRRGHGAGAL